MSDKIVDILDNYALVCQFGIDLDARKQARQALYEEILKVKPKKKSLSTYSVMTNNRNGAYNCALSDFQQAIKKLMEV